MADSNEFSKSFAEALAFELQQNESRKPTDDELLKDTYVQLCHDDPHNWTARGCDLLAKALLDEKHPYTLSERLFEGVEQVSKRHAEQKTAKEEEENTTALASLAMARLAFTVHIRIPLACLAQKNDIVKIVRLLGSYRGSEVVKPCAGFDATHPLLGGGDSEVRQFQSGDEEGIEEKKEPNASSSKESSTMDDHNSLEEVWAAESDPSDYAFESDHQPAALPDLDDWASSWLDPTQLSQPCHSDNIQDMAKAVTSLLQSTRYSSHLMGLTTQDWKDAWPLWTQWILTLLVAQPSVSPLLQTSPSDSDELASTHWRHVGLHLLHLVRDAAMDRSTFLLTDYIQLIQTLLQVQAAAEEDGQADKVAPATWVGLGALAATCQHFESCTAVATLQILQSCILEACDDLTLVLERSMPKDEEDRQSQLTLQWTVASLFQMLLGPHSNDLPKAHAQKLLQSGLFRQWLLHWSAINPNGDNLAAPSVLLELCAKSPILLGKYTWRFPGLAYSLCKSTEPIVDGLLWNLLGIELASEPSTSRFQLKGKAAESAPPSENDCQHKAWSVFQVLCSRLQSTLDSYNTSCTRSFDNDDISAVRDFSAFVSRLSRLPSLACNFATKMAPSADGKSSSTVIQAVLQPIREQLSQVVVETSVKEEPEDEADDAKKDSMPKKTRMTLALQELRRDVKVLSTILLDDYTTGNAGHDATTSPRRAPSSKAD